MDIVVIGIPELSMLDPKAGVWGEQEFIEGIDTQDMEFIEYVEVIGDMALAEVAIVDGSAEYSF